MEEDKEYLGSAYIGDIELKVDANGKQIVSIPYHFSLGKRKPIRQNSVLIKPFQKLLLQGKPLGKIAFSFYGENNEYWTTGAFANTMGKKILFFPGSTSSRVIHSPDGEKILNEIHSIDHFSLEHNLRNWHITLQEKRIKGYKYSKLKTRKINDDVFLWFVMAVSNTKLLEPIPNTQEYLIESNSIRDIERRLNIFLSSREGCLFPVIEWKHDSPSPCFLNFEVYVLTNNKEEHILPENPFVLPPPFSKLEIMDKGIRSRSCYPFPVGESMSICIRVSKIKGSLSQDVVFFSGGGYA